MHFKEPHEEGVGERSVLGPALVLTASAFAVSLALYGGVLPADRHKVAAMGLVAGAVWVCWLSIRRRTDRGTGGTGVDLAALAWVAGLGCLALASAGWSIDRGASLWEGALLLGAPAAFLAGASLTERGPNGADAAPVMGALATLGLVVAVGSLIGFAVRGERWIQVQEQAHLLSGPFGYANAMAGLMLMTIPATLGCLAWPPSGDVHTPGPAHRRRGANTVRRAVLWSGLAAQLTTLTFTASRAAMGVAALLLVLAVTLPHSGRLPHAFRRLRERRAGGVLMVLFVVFGSVVMTVVLWRAGSYAVGLWQGLHDKTATADQNRLQIWHAAAEAAGRRPILGYGSDTFFSAYMPFRIPWSAPARFAHNLFVQQWVELGAAGVGVLVGTLVFLLARPVARRTLWGAEPGFWLLFGPAAIVLQNLVDITWYFPAIYFLFLFEAGVLSAWSLGARACDGSPIGGQVLE